LLPDYDIIAPDPADAAHIRRALADQELGSERGLAQLGMGEPQVVVSLGHVVAELVGKAEAEPPRRSRGIDQVNPRQFGLLAAILRKVRHGQRRPGSGEMRAVALVEPLRLAAGF